jgi:hypothetical protein
MWYIHTGGYGISIPEGGVYLYQRGGISIPEGPVHPYRRGGISIPEGGTPPSPPINAFDVSYSTLFPQFY